ncbi:hypothetical protein Bsph_3639 [Lysinibacillus sphaericus C3-41]|uniref:Uncharacterized protein n=1 Tax=Lysinibacillus sphaericus (strain C3-41) TaxID=444177 RepID=B1HSR7_LYSSC|nr:hypothetical protein Bsph_3639 [Lysinibacillus sphaericus C3-41]
MTGKHALDNYYGKHHLFDGIKSGKVALFVLSISFSFLSNKKRLYLSDFSP